MRRLPGRPATKRICRYTPGLRAAIVHGRKAAGKWHASSVFEGFQKVQIDVGEASVLCAMVATAPQLSCYTDTHGLRPHGIGSPRS